MATVQDILDYLNLEMPNRVALINAAAANSYVRFPNPTVGKTVELRTPAEVLSDIGAAASSHTHAQADISDLPITIANGGTGQTTAVAAFDALGPGTTKGDLLIHNGADHIRLPIGSDTQVLTADSAEASGVKWAAAAGGASQLSDLSDVNTSTPTSGNVLRADGVDWESAVLASTDLSDITSGAVDKDGSVNMYLANADFIINMGGIGDFLVQDGGVDLATFKADGSGVEIANDLKLTAANKLFLRDSAIYIHSNQDGQLTIEADTQVNVSRLISTHNMTIGAGAVGTDYTLTFDGDTFDGVLVWLEGEDEFEFKDDVRMWFNQKLRFGDDNQYIHSNAADEITISAVSKVNIVKPAIGATDWANANHDHAAASGGGALAASAVDTAGAVMDGDFSVNGLMGRTGAGAYTNRSIAGTTDQIAVTDGDGVSGDPTIALASDPVVPGTGSLLLPDGTTAQRPGTPVNGMIRYNTTTGKFEGHEAGAWTDLVGGASGAVLETDYDAYTILAADVDNTPVALTVNPSTFLGRRSTGGIVAMSKYQAANLILPVESTTAIVKHTVNGQYELSFNLATLSANRTLYMKDKNIRLTESASIHPTPIASRYYAPIDQHGQNLFGGVTPAANRMYAIPIYVPDYQTIESLAVEIKTSNATNKLKLGLYTIGTDGNPDALAYAGGEMTFASTGVKEDVAISYAAWPGWYWLAVLVKEAGGAFAQAAGGVSAALLGASSAGGLSAAFYLYRAQSYNIGFPNPFGGSITYVTSTGPLVEWSY